MVSSIAAKLCTSSEGHQRALVPRKDPTMADETPAATTAHAAAFPQIDLHAFEEAAARVKDLNDKLLASAKSAGSVSLDAYEKALAGMIDFSEKAAQMTGLEWVVTAAHTQTALVKEVNEAMAKTARQMLS